MFYVHTILDINEGNAYTKETFKNDKNFAKIRLEAEVFRLICKLFSAIVYNCIIYRTPRKLLQIQLHAQINQSETRAGLGSTSDDIFESLFLNNYWF